MKKLSIQKVLGTLLLLFVVIGASAQATKLRINEVMLHNENNYIDQFGQRNGWFEIFNTSYSTVDLGGCYLTDDLSNPKKYYIQKGDVLTKIKPRQHVVFYADSDPNLGTFHVNFNLQEKYFIALFDANGETLIDSVSISEMPVDVSIGRMIDGSKALATGENALWRIMPTTTPSTNNTTVENNTSIERFLEHDPWGIGMSITAMTVVFLALAFLYLIFKAAGKINVSMSSKRAIKEAEQAGEPVISKEKLGEIPGEVYAAIGAALYEFENDAHDIENTILTIEQVTRRYSPWSSKIHTLRETPTVKARTKK